MSVYSNGYISTLNKWLSDYSEQIHNSLYRIDFKDIVNNPNKVKIILEDITNKKLSTHAHRQYDRYVEVQLEFRKEKGLL
jgi:hypothetical protein